MSKSSGHIGGGSGGNTSHNSRERFSFSQVFFDEQNQVNKNQQDAMKMFRDLLRERSGKYTERTGQKLQKNTLTHLSTIINLLPHHEIEDLDPIVKFLEERLDTKVFQVAVHRDEGKLVHKETGEILTSGEHFFADPKTQKHFYDENYTKPLNLDEYRVEKNYHAHIEMMGLDSEGNSIKRNKMHVHMLMDFQDVVAETLGMERGKKSQRYTKDEILEIRSKLKPIEKYSSKREYAKAFNQVAKDLGYFIDKRKKTKRKDTHDFKAEKARENELLAPVLAKQKDLKAEIAKLRAELKESGAGRAEYAELEQLNRDLKARIKAKDLTVNELQMSISNLSHEVQELEEKLEEVVENTYCEVKHYNPEIESIEVEKVLYKDLYVEKEKEIEELVVELKEHSDYIERLEQGYSDIEVVLFGKDEGKKVEELVEAVGILTTVIQRASKFMNQTVEQFMKYFSSDSEPKTDEKELKSDLEGKSLFKTEKTLKSDSKSNRSDESYKATRKRKNR